MRLDPSALGGRVRVWVNSLLARLGFRDDAFLLLLAVLIGLVTAAAAVGFHALVELIRDLLYVRGDQWLSIYAGWGVLALLLLPMLGGLVVGVANHYLFRHGESHGVVDVMQTVLRSGGVVRSRTAIEKILTSAMTIGSGGSAGAEGPIVQIGAAISSFFAQFFRLARHHMPAIIGCGTAAGISAIFNAPIGGVLFTLEVILLDFSFRTFTPVVIASVIANVATQGIYLWWTGQRYEAIFNLSGLVMPETIPFGHTLYFAVLGVLAGLIGVMLIRMMGFSERQFARLPVHRMFRPAIGGMLLGVIGAAYIVIFGWMLLGQAKPIEFSLYPMPAFFGDGYGAVQPMLTPAFYQQAPGGTLLLVLSFLLVAKLVGTCLTLGSGGSGGVIAPSLFLGAVAGGALGELLRLLGLDIQPHFMALIGMGAVLAAVVHAPLAAILILFEVTRERSVMLPAMLCTVLATGVAQYLFRDSIYTMALRARGILAGTKSDLTILRRLSLESVALDPATTVRIGDPFQRVLDLSLQTRISDFVVVDAAGHYAGLIVDDDIRTALLQREAVPLLVVSEIARTDVKPLRSTDDLATALEAFSRHEVTSLPVCVASSPRRIIGMVTRTAVMTRYQQALSE